MLRLAVATDAETLERIREPLADRGIEAAHLPTSRRAQPLDGDREPFLTVKGANAHPPERGVVTVDAGAVGFVTDGADVMRPGIVDADEGIAAGDLVAVNEETHGKFLAVGRALVDGTEMLGEEGRVVESVHHVGDDLYEFSV